MPLGSKLPHLFEEPGQTNDSERERKSKRASSSSISRSTLGLARASKDDQIKVRQDNKMASRSLKGLKEGNAAGRYVSLEHPWGSLL